MKTSDLQHDSLMTAIKSAKVNNSEALMSVINSEKVSLVNREFNTNRECTIKESLQSLSMHGYEYEATELDRVINILNKI